MARAGRDREMDFMLIRGCNGLGSIGAVMQGGRKDGLESVAGLTLRGGGARKGSIH